MNREFSVVIEREDDGGYSVYVPDLPGCASMGDTRAEALSNIRDAIEVYTAGMRKLGRKLPARRSSIRTIRVKAA